MCILHSTTALLLPKLRSHYAEFLNRGSLARLRILSLPTCVGFGTGTFPLARGFSWQCGINQFGYSSSPPHHSSGFSQSGFAYSAPYLLRHPSIRVLTYPPASPHHSIEKRWYRNLNLLSIDYAFRPRLRPRLTLSGRTFLRKP